MTPDDLVEHELIKRLKHAYCRLLDQKRFVEMSELFVEDGTTSYGGGAIVLNGRQELVDYLTKNMSSTTMLTSHQVVMPEIEVSGDRATASWALRDVVILQDLGLAIRGASYYDDRYVKVDGRWLIEHTGYKRLYEEIGPRAEGTRTTASWWDTDGRSSLV